MLLVYISRTNNIEKIVKKMQLKSCQVINLMDDLNLKIDKDFCILTYTDFLGQIPKEVEIFLENNWKNLKAVAGSGNRNFGKNFCAAAKKISHKYNVPIFQLFELSGDDESIQEFKNKINQKI